MRKFFSAFASVSLVANVFAPTVLAADLEITENGVNSTNIIKVETSNATVVDQANDSVILTGAFSSASTGENKANNNTGGDVTVKSGSATASTSVSVTGSSNYANVDPACGCNPLPDITIDGNGVNSFNKVKYTDANATVALQWNISSVGTLAVAKAKTGKNKAKYNTGGTVLVQSGPAVSTTGVTVGGSTNTLNP